ncbi:hypothetical protein [Paenibacillus sp. NPDC058071]|uniref:hypothetical protein n=1 Tax=Paenibacillus sp. NPDC058071 TaxID=3346326 RepID=UPI0036DABD1B
MMIKWVLYGVALLLIAGLGATPTKAFALSCAVQDDIGKSYEAYDGIILGRVEEVTQKNDHNEVRATVKENYKGVAGEQVTFDEDATWGSLWGPSESGEEYLFFLKEKDGKWENPLCSPTAKAADASESKAWLAKKAGLPDSSTAQGQQKGDASSDGTAVATGGETGVGSNSPVLILSSKEKEAADRSGQTAGERSAAAGNETLSAWPVLIVMIVIMVVAASAVAIGIRKARKNGE